MKRVLLIANDSVGLKMASPGIRYLHFAQELASRFDVTLLVDNDPREVELEGVQAIGSRSDRSSQIRELAQSQDVIVAHGGVNFRSMVFLAGTDVRTIYDLYVPFFEMLTFQGGLGQPNFERRNNWRAYCLRHRILLLTGRAFIGANEPQCHALLGALAALGRISLEDYRLDPLLGHLVRAVGLGVDAEPPRATVSDVRATLPGACVNDKVLIWPGNLWDWFDPETLIRAMAKISATREDIKLYCLGVDRIDQAGPYGQMTMPGRAIRLAEELRVKDRTVFFEFGWSPYKQRQNYLLAADIGVNIHSRHVETTFAHRTRILDYLWAGLPVVTTEGGALSDLVERNGLGRTVRFEDVGDCARAILELCDDSAEYERVRTRVVRFRERMAWPQTVEPLVELIEAPQSPVQGRLAVRAFALEYAFVRGVAPRPRVRKGVRGG